MQMEDGLGVDASKVEPKMHTGAPVKCPSISRGCVVVSNALDEARVVHSCEPRWYHVNIVFPSLRNLFVQGFFICQKRGDAMRN